MSLKIQTRPSWKARTPRPRTRQNVHAVHELFLHYPGDPHGLAHIDTDQEQDAYMRAVQDFHMDVRKWSDIGYSFAVFQDGQVYRARGGVYVPAAQLDHNTNTFAVLCVVGISESPTGTMFHALERLRDYLENKSGNRLRVRAHGDVTQTSCPGLHVRAMIPHLNRG